jgi:hypothetical protein
MKDTEYIVGIYNYFNPLPEIQNESGYYFLYFIDEAGLLEMEFPTKIFEKNFKSGLIDNENVPGIVGPFSSTEALNQFAFQFCEELNAEKVSLLSVEEYNVLLENSHNGLDFHRDLLAKGNVIENIERKKKGFLSRFF